MVQEKINLILKKIQTILDPSGEISSLEQDLIKGYLRELYEMVDQLGPRRGEEKARIEPSNSKPVQPKPARRIDKDPIRQEQTFAFIETPEDSPTEEVQSPTSITEIVVEEDSPSVKQNATGAKKQSESDDYKSETLTEVLTTKAPSNKDFDELFAVGHAKDLSEKLSRRPIHDLHRAFSINDRLLVTDRLFGGSAEEFLDTLDILNSKHSFEDARVYLERYVIAKFNWLDDTRKDQARDFITLVSRRYSD